MLIHILTPRLTNFAKVMQEDIFIIWALKNNIFINWLQSCKICLNAGLVMPLFHTILWSPKSCNMVELTFLPRQAPYRIETTFLYKFFEKVQLVNVKMSDNMFGQMMMMNRRHNCKVLYMKTLYVGFIFHMVYGYSHCGSIYMTLVLHI